MEYRLQTKGEGDGGASEVVGKQEEKGEGGVEEDRQQQGEENNESPRDTTYEERTRGNQIKLSTVPEKLRPTCDTQKRRKEKNLCTTHAAFPEGGRRRACRPHSCTGGKAAAVVAARCC
ncbi:hypothetical protein E2C01_043814 [Portunus trituberculatus]|uniref:Uncharacterized protein n=1 Tax=Portunus trituberculatus TaxID=210409 RepID=A0A5B7FWP0_PORTR|nr:hypothetical protein [Portunus trituberculatus]